MHRAWALSHAPLVLHPMQPFVIVPHLSLLPTCCERHTYSLAICHEPFSLISWKKNKKTKPLIWWIKGFDQTPLTSLRLYPTSPSFPHVVRGIPIVSNSLAMSWTFQLAILGKKNNKTFDPIKGFDQTPLTPLWFACTSLWFACTSKNKSSLPHSRGVGGDQILGGLIHYL